MAEHSRCLKSITVVILMIILCVYLSPSISYADDSPGRSRLIVSMGDSYSSGEGVSPFWDDYEKYIETGKDDRSIEEKIEDLNWLAHRSIWAWSGQLILPDVGVVNLTKHNENPNWVFVASSGAETKHILSEGQYKPIKKGKYKTSEKDKTATRLQPQINVFKELNSMNITPDYVTLTIGGNDAGFEKIITTAAIEPFHVPCFLKLKLNNVWKEFEAKGGIRDNLKEVYNRIFEETGESTCILVGGYPLLFSPDDCAFFSTLPSSDAVLINNNVHEFNEEIKALVEECKRECKKNKHKEMNIEFVSVEKAFGGNGENGEICEHGAFSKEPFINGLITEMQPDDLKDSGLVSAYSIHPNIYGICAYRDCFQEKINENEKKKDKNLPDNWIDEYKANAIREDSIGIGINIKDTPTIVPEETTTGGMNINTEVTYAAYREVLHEYESQMRYYEDFGPTNSCALTDLTGDGLPELIILYDTYHPQNMGCWNAGISIYTVVPGNTVATEMFCDNRAIYIDGRSIEVILLSNGNLFIETSEHIHDGLSERYSYVEYWVDDYSYVPLNTLNHCDGYYDRNSNLYEEYINEYTYNETSLSEADFNSFLKDYKNQFVSVLAMCKLDYSSSEWLSFVNTLPNWSLSFDEAWEMLNSINNDSDPTSNTKPTEEQINAAFANYLGPTVLDYDGPAPCYWGVVSMDGNLAVILYRAYTGTIFYYHVYLNTGCTYINKYNPNTGREEPTDEYLYLWDYLE